MIQAKVVADSINEFGNRLTTLEVIMPRYILAEFNTHRMFSRNSASSRAIRFETMVKSIQENPFIPYAWQKDHNGMQGNEYWTNETFVGKNNNTMLYTDAHKQTWLDTMNGIIEQMTILNDKEQGSVTKQLCNRPLEAFMYHKVLVTATEWENFFELRCPQYGSEETGYFKSRKDALKYLENRGTDILNLEHNDVLGWLKVNKGQADIHMMFTAEAIYDSINESIPKLLKEGEWHLPYGDDMSLSSIVRLAIEIGLLESKESIDDYSDEEIDSTIDLISKISIVRCARVSYHIAGKEQVIDYKADLELYDRLAKSKHASPFEHIARNMTQEERNYHIKQEGNSIEYGWSRNFKGFLQYRELINL